MDERRGGEPEHARERPGEHDAAKLRVARAQLPERRREPAEPGGVGGGERGEREADAGGRAGDPDRDHVGGAHREREPRGVVGERAIGGATEAAEPAKLPRVEGGVEEDAASAHEHEEARVTPRREVFGHRVVDGSW